MKALKVNNKLVKSFYYNGKIMGDKYDFEIELTDSESKAMKWQDDDITINRQAEVISRKYEVEIVGIDEQLELKL